MEHQSIPLSRECFPTASNQTGLKEERLRSNYDWFILASVGLTGAGIVLLILELANPQDFVKQLGSLLILIGVMLFGIGVLFFGISILALRGFSKPAEAEAKTTLSEPPPRIYDKIQYQRVAEEIRIFEGLVWQIPSFAFTVAAALVIGAFQFLSGNPIARTLVLSLASIFLFGMGQTTIKHRFAIAVRQELIRNMERDWGDYQIPAGVRNQLTYLKETQQGLEVLEKIKGGLAPEWLIKWSSHLLMAVLLFSASLLIIIVAFVTFSLQ